MNTVYKSSSDLSSLSQPNKASLLNFKYLDLYLEEI